MKKLLCAAFAMTMVLTGCGSSNDSAKASENTGKEYFTVGMECGYALLTGRLQNRLKQVLV